MTRSLSLNHPSKRITFHPVFSHKPYAMCVVLMVTFQPKHYVFTVVETAVETSWHFLCFFPPLHLFFSYDGTHDLNKGLLLFCGETHLLIVCNLFSVPQNAQKKKESVSDVLTCAGSP